jgi:maleate cis-trans isomerase
MAEGLTGWRMHLGAIFPTPVPPRAIREFYEMAPDGVDVTTNSLTIQQLSDNDMDDAILGMERAAKQLANFDVDVIYQAGVPPIVRKGLGYHRELADRLSQAAGLPVVTDMGAVLDAMHAMGIKTVAMATPFQQFINDRLVQYLANEGIEVVNNRALGILRNTEIRRLPIPVEYQTAHQAYTSAPVKADGLYIACGGWGSVHNIEPLERDLDTTVVTWANAMLWAPMQVKRVVEPITGFGKVLASQTAKQPVLTSAAPASPVRRTA